MPVLSSRNIQGYLQQQRLLLPGEKAVISKVADGGFINTVFVVSRERNSFVVKQTLKEAQGAAIKPRQERFSYEVAALRLIMKYLPDAPVPKLLFVDPKNFIFAMSKAPEKEGPYQTMLMQGTFRWGAAQDIPRKIGAFLANLHSATWKRKKVAERMRDNPGYRDLRFGPSLEFPAKKNPALYPLLQEIFRNNERNQFCFVHADTTPKNVLVSDGQITVLDFEAATFGDPAQDVGITLAHFLLPIWKNPRWCDDYLKCGELFLQEYFSRIKFTLPTKSLVQNIKNNCAAMMLGRVDGIIEFDYLKKHKAAVREVVSNLLRLEAATAPELMKVIRKMMEEFFNRERIEVSS